MNTEKITLNISAIDLANIDLLVENGFASNRSELLKTAIKHYLSNLGNETKKLIQIEEMQAEKSKYHWVFGGHRLSLNDVEKCIDSNEKITYVIYGILLVEKGVSLSKLKKCITGIKVYGIIKANKEIKDFIKNSSF